VEREEEMIRRLAPVDPKSAEAGAETPAAGDEATQSEPAPVPAWRRTAMAELTALAAADSDDLTPRRRR
jgi:hypothetical protein